ncbi:plastocyanin [Gloeobacter violaceus]|uniref:Plastocyanin n=1 Tax=Gloeobacter violaceus (strain ATCC 29082 / PCC 7421) TaxID=251221 RepID=Q7NI43_GLOVI|nr:plastocyanin [Gloeobacter violaceus]BAC90282.1 plastocyanin [Gloeobacter violaceus PCC 7421]
MISWSKFAACSLAALVAVCATGLAAGAKEIEVKMGADTGRLVYVPAKIDAAPGDTIKWTMNKAGPHNAVFDAAKSADPAGAKAMSQSKLLNKPKDSYISTIPANAKKGDYAFYCTPHKSTGMVGTLTIK